jgi:excisionase family DNA binding protein
VTDLRTTPDRRKGPRPDGGLRCTDPILKLETHKAPFVEVSQLADYWGLHFNTVLYYIRRQKLKAYRFGRAYRIKRDDALAFERGRLFTKQSA